jgi:hypothetical protein
VWFGRPFTGGNPAQFEVGDLGADVFCATKSVYAEASDVRVLLEPRELRFAKVSKSAQGLQTMRVSQILEAVLRRFYALFTSRFWDSASSIDMCLEFEVLVSARHD